MECTFCGKEIRKGSESMFVTNKGKLLYFCSSKCEKNQLKLRRSNRKVKWTKAYKKEKEARIKLLKEGVKPEEIRKLEKKAEKAVEKEDTVKEEPAPKEEKKEEKSEKKPKKQAKK